jgi:hypothetical protein
MPFPDLEQTLIPRQEPVIAAGEDLIRILFQGQDCCLPDRQCLYCGRLDTDQRGYPFKKHSKTCHAPGCDSSDPTPKADKKGCCSAAWRKLKKSFHAKCRHHQQQKHRLIEIFQDFCETRYQANLQMNKKVRPRTEKPDSLKFLYES